MFIEIKDGNIIMWGFTALTCQAKEQLKKTKNTPLFSQF